MATGLAVTIIVARLLDPEGAGLVGFSLWLAMALATMTDRGIPQTVLLYGTASANDSDATTIAASAFRRFLPLPLLAALLLVITGLITAVNTDGIDGDIVLAVTLLFLLYALSMFSINVSRGRGDFRTPALNMVLGALLQIPCVIAGALFLGPAGALMGVAIRFIPQLAPLTGLFKHLKAAKHYRPTAEMNAYGHNMWLSDMIGIVLMTRIEYLVLAIFLTGTDLGLFAVAVVFAGLVEQMSMQLSSPLLVSFSARTAVPAGQADLYRRALVLLAAIVMPVALGGAALMPKLMPLVFGDLFSAAAIPAILLLASSIASALTVVPWALLAAKGHARMLTRIQVASAGIYLPILFAAVPFFGLQEAAAIRLLAEILTLVLLLAAARRYEKLSPPSFSLMVLLNAAIVCALVAYFIDTSIPGLSGTICAVAAGMVIYAAALRVSRILSIDEISPILDELEMRLPAVLSRPVRLLAGVVASH